MAKAEGRDLRTLLELLRRSYSFRNFEHFVAYLIYALPEIIPKQSHAYRERLSLTSREAEVMVWVVRGKTNAEVGAIMGISPRTVQKHLEHVFEKLGVETRTAAAVRALEAHRADEAA